MPPVSISPVRARRRTVLTGIAGGSALMGLSACGVFGSDSGKDGGTDTRTIETDNGSVNVPKNPERIIACENWDAIMLMDVDLVAVGVPDHVANAALLPSDMYEAFKDITTIGASGSPNAQAIGKLKPDLIIDQFWPEQSAALDTIAPVAYFAWDGTGGALWYEQVDKIANAVNRSDKLEEAKQHYADRLAELSDTYAEAIEKSVWAPLSGGPNGTFYLGAPLLTLLRDVGLTIGADIADDEAGFTEKSYEDLDILNDCTVLVYPSQFDGAAPAVTQELLDNEVWQGLKPVQAERAFGMTYYSVGSYRWASGALDEIEEILKQL